MAFSIGRPYPVAAIVEELAGKESVKVVASARSVLGMRGEKAMNSAPGLVIDDRVMKAFMDLALMGQPPKVDRVREDLVEVPPLTAPSHRRSCIRTPTR